MEMNKMLAMTILVLISLKASIHSYPLLELGHRGQLASASESQSLFQLTNDEPESIVESVQKAFSNLATSVLNNNTLNISDKCKKILAKAYVMDKPKSKSSTADQTQAFYIMKVFSDSSKNDNDISTYSECVTKKYGYKINPNMTYLIIVTETIINKDSQFQDSQIVSTLFGICVVNGCQDTEYKNVINMTNDYLNSILNFTNATLTVLTLSKNDPELAFHSVNLLNLIPFFIVVLFLLCVFFNAIPYHLFKLCYRERNTTLRINNTNVSEISAEIISFPNKKLNELKAAFDITENGEELYKGKAKQGEVNQDLGLTYIKGIRGLSMLFLIFGFFFFDLYNSPIAIQAEKTFSEFFGGYLFPIFFIGLRYSPKLLFSCSGYCLFYKFISFLDEKSEKKQEIRRINSETEKKNEDPETITEDLNVSLSQQLENASSENIDKIQDDVPFSFLVYFYLYQIHKYILYIILILFMKYSLFHIVNFIKSEGPMWLYFNKRILQNGINLSRPIKELLTTLGLINGFMFWDMNKRSFLNYFWIVENEIIFFIITTFIIFLGYKFQFRSDRIFLFSIIIIFIIKLVVYCYYAFAEELMNSVLYYYYLNFGLFSISPYYNSIYYFIGVYFSIINYSIQKGMTYEEADRQFKPFLLVSVRYANLFKKQSKKTLYIIGFIGFILLIFMSFFQYFALLITQFANTQPIEIAVKAFINSTGIKVFYFIDGDFALVIIHCICLACYTKGDNLMNSFLSSSFWRMYDQFYYSFILLINPVILYLLYQSETRITFDFWNCFFYSLICVVLLIVLGSIVYICFEAPLRRIIRLMLHFRQEKKNEIQSSKIQSEAGDD